MHIQMVFIKEFPFLNVETFIRSRLNLHLTNAEFLNTCTSRDAMWLREWLRWVTLTLKNIELSSLKIVQTYSKWPLLTWQYSACSLVRCSSDKRAKFRKIARRGTKDSAKKNLVPKITARGYNFSCAKPLYLKFNRKISREDGNLSLCPTRYKYKFSLYYSIRNFIL